jgi:hypothetical protein
MNKYAATNERLWLRIKLSKCATRAERHEPGSRRWRKHFHRWEKVERRISVLVRKINRG